MLTVNIDFGNCTEMSSLDFNSLKEKIIFFQLEMKYPVFIKENLNCHTKI